MHYEDALNLLRKEVLTPNRQKFQEASRRQQLELLRHFYPEGYGHGGLYFIGYTGDSEYCRYAEPYRDKDKNQIVGLNLMYHSYANPAIKSTEALSQIDTLRELYITIPPKQELIEGLGAIRHLEKLGLSFCRWPNKEISLQPLSNLQQLTHFVCRGQRLNDLSGIEHWKKIKYLDLSDNQIRDISPLSALTTLRYLYLSNNLIEDLSPMPHCEHSLVFRCSKNPLHQLPPLRIISNIYTYGAIHRAPNEAEQLLWDTQQEELQKIWQLLRSKVADNIALGKALLSSLGWSDAWLISFGRMAEDVG